VGRALRVVVVDVVVQNGNNEHLVAVGTFSRMIGAGSRPMKRRISVMT
jgi:hypothetical protein